MSKTISLTVGRLIIFALAGAVLVAVITAYITSSVVGARLAVSTIAQQLERIGVRATYDTGDREALIKRLVSYVSVIPLIFLS